MRVVIQRVSEASVTIDGGLISSIQKGLLVLASFETTDTHEDLEWTCNKITQLRVFDNSQGVMNLSVKDINGEILAVSQFTLHAKTKKGNRPSYMRASKSIVAIPIYELMIAQLEKDLGKKIFTGGFGADMKVALINDGPVTIWIDTKNKE